MSAITIGFLTFIFVGFTLISQMMQAAMVQAGDIAILNQITIFRTMNLLGLANISVPNISFFTQGIPHLMQWDYAFFGGNAGLIQYFMYSFSGMVAFGCVVIGLGILGFYFFKL